MQKVCLLQNEYGVNINIRLKESSVDWSLIHVQPEIEKQPERHTNTTVWHRFIAWISAPFVFLVQWFKRMEVPYDLFSSPVYPYPVFGFGGSFVMLYPHYYPIFLDEYDEIVVLPEQQKELLSETLQ